jgi:hypothetical protein
MLVVRIDRRLGRLGRLLDRTRNRLDFGNRPPQPGWTRLAWGRALVGTAARLGPGAHIGPGVHIGSFAGIRSDLGIELRLIDAARRRKRRVRPRTVRKQGALRRRASLSVPAFTVPAFTILAITILAIDRAKRAQAARHPANRKHHPAQFLHRGGEAQEDRAAHEGHRSGNHKGQAELGVPDRHAEWDREEAGDQRDDAEDQQEVNHTVRSPALADCRLRVGRICARSPARK